MKDIAVLLTVFNRCEKTISCLKNLYAQKLPKNVSFDVWLTDDNCTDGTPLAVAKEYPEVHILTGEGILFWNRGMINAWEAAAKYKDYDAYLWLNDDTNLNKGALETLVKTADEAGWKKIIVGSCSKIDNPSIITYGGRNAKKHLLRPSLNKAIECSFFNGNIVLIPQFVYKVLGTNDPVFHHSLGDFDYGLRGVKKNIQSLIAPGILGECDRHEALPSWCNPQKTLLQRWNAFHSPLGCNPKEFFIFEFRHYGFLRAYFHW